MLEVTDEQVPANAGRWRLRGSPTDASCSSTVDEPDLSCDIRAVGAAYLGGAPLSSLAATGQITEHRPGALARAGALTGADLDQLRIISAAAQVHVVKSGPAQAHHGDTLNLTYAVHSSNGALHDVVVTDDHCSPVSSNPTKQNDDGDALLEDVGQDGVNPEIWTYSCSYAAPSHSVGEENPIHDTATATAKDESDQPARSARPRRQGGGPVQ